MIRIFGVDFGKQTTTIFSGDPLTSVREAEKTLTGQDWASENKEHTAARTIPVNKSAHKPDVVVSTQPEKVINAALPQGLNRRAFRKFMDTNPSAEEVYRYLANI